MISFKMDFQHLYAILSVIITICLIDVSTQGVAPPRLQIPGAIPLGAFPVQPNYNERSLNSPGPGLIRVRRPPAHQIKQLNAIPQQQLSLDEAKPVTEEPEDDIRPAFLQQQNFQQHQPQALISPFQTKESPLFEAPQLTRFNNAPPHLQQPHRISLPEPIEHQQQRFAPSGIDSDFDSIGGQRFAFVPDRPQQKPIVPAPPPPPQPKQHVQKTVIRRPAPATRQFEEEDQQPIRRIQQQPQQHHHQQEQVRPRTSHEHSQNQIHRSATVLRQYDRPAEQQQQRLAQHQPSAIIQEPIRRIQNPPVQLIRPRNSAENKEREKKPVAQILRKYREENEDGSITWGFENDDGSYKEEIIGIDCVTRGRYGYVDPDGEKREYTYETGNKCDPNKRDQEEDDEETAIQGGGSYIDYQENTMVLSNGDRIDLSNVGGKNKARKPSGHHQQQQQQQYRN